MDDVETTADAGGMTPLGTLIRAALDRQHLSVRRLETLGGPPEATTRRLLSKDPQANRNPPEDEALRRLANTLRVPLSRVYLAAAQTKGWVPLDAEPAHPDARLLQDTIGRLDAASAAVLTDAVLLIAERLAALSPTAVAAVAADRQRTRGTEGAPANTLSHPGEPEADLLPMAARRGRSRGRALRAEQDAAAEQPHEDAP